MSSSSFEAFSPLQAIPKGLRATSQTPPPPTTGNRKSDITKAHKTQTKKDKRAAFEALVKRAIPGKAKAAPLRNFKKQLARKVDKKEEAIERRDRIRAAIIDRLVEKENFYQPNYDGDNEGSSDESRHQNANQHRHENHQARGIEPRAQQTNNDLDLAVGGSKMILEIIGEVVNYGWYITFPA